MIAETWSYDNAKSPDSRAKNPPMLQGSTWGKGHARELEREKSPRFSQEQPMVGHLNNPFIKSLRLIEWAK